MRPPSQPCRPPQPGDLLVLDGAASPQFSGDRAVRVRVIGCRDWPTYEGWIWIDAYQLDQSGNAIERRQVYIRIAGIRRERTQRNGTPR